MNVVISISGASGAAIGVGVLKNLKGHKVHLIISEGARGIVEKETDYTVDEIGAMAFRVYDNDNMDVSIASGTAGFDAVVIAPCSTSTLSKIACGIADNLITRVAAVALKERRKLIIVPRETPLSTVVLRRMYELSSMGAIIMPPVPAFYLRPQSTDDIVDYIVGKILDHLGVKHELYRAYEP